MRKYEGQGVFDELLVENEKNIFENNGSDCNPGNDIFPLPVDP
jgi:hypothetical protein